MFNRIYKGFKKETAVDIQIRQKKKKEFIICGERSATLKIFKNDAKHILNDYLSKQKSGTGITGFYVKSKDKRFELLDSIKIYTKEAAKLINKQMSNKQTNYWHTKEIHTVINNMYTIYNVYSDESIISLIDEKNAKEFRYAMRAGLFMSAMFTSRFDEANKLLDVMRKDAAKSIEGIDRNQESLKGALNTVKSTIEEKYLRKMNAISSVLLREQELFDFHKTAFNFYIPKYN